MRIRSVGHACLEIEANGLRVVTDPWWAGPAYTNQWHAWPTPQPAGLEERAIDYLYLSHGHEDHLHLPTLRRLRRNATVLVPEFLGGEMASFLRDGLGFCEVIELRHGETVQLRRGLKATCYINATDSILVLEDGDRVLVDANDALHASPPAVIDHFCRLLRSRHASIDTLFLGYSGAAWFPNCQRFPGKNDRAAARAREELFTGNFVRIVEQLRPRLACAFAASFVLVEPSLRWINDVRFEVTSPEIAYRKRHPDGGTRTHLLLPDDRIDGIDVSSGGVPRPTKELLDEAFGTSLREPADRAAQLPGISADHLRDLVARIDARAQANESRLKRRAALEVELRPKDAPGHAIRVHFDGHSARATLGPQRRTPVSLELRTEILEALLDEPYGVESITIGYGALGRLEKPQQMEQLNDLLRLLSPKRGALDSVAREVYRSPLRALKAAWSQRWPLALTAAGRLGLMPTLNEWRALASEAVEPAPSRRQAA